MSIVGPPEPEPSRSPTRVPSSSRTVLPPYVVDVDVDVDVESTPPLVKSSNNALSVASSGALATLLLLPGGSAPIVRCTEVAVGPPAATTAARPVSVEPRTAIPPGIATLATVKMLPPNAAPGLLCQCDPIAFTAPVTVPHGCVTAQTTVALTG